MRNFVLLKLMDPGRIAKMSRKNKEKFYKEEENFIFLRLYTYKTLGLFHLGLFRRAYHIHSDFVVRF